VIVAAINKLEPLVGLVKACKAVGMARATFYRHHRPKARPLGPQTAVETEVAAERERETRAASAARRRRAQPRALDEAERERVLDVLHSGRFVDMAVEEVFHTLLDEGTYLCSVSSMYRILRERGESRERRRQATHPPRVKPELIATGPNQVWTWDITKLKGPRKWEYFQLYSVIDIYSRYTPAWMVASRESDKLAEVMFTQAIADQHIRPRQLTIHADNGSSMTSKTVAQLLVDLKVTKSHSRPHVSNDNPYSESQFKTLKYGPTFPDRFDSIEQARLFCKRFFDWYNNQHHHSGIGYHTPASVHYARTDPIDEARAAALTDAYNRHPERFIQGIPKPPEIPGPAWINRPTQEATP
jgi:putative transposase